MDDELTRLLDLLERSIQRTDTVVTGLTAEHLGLPTPCEEMNVQALFGHLVGGLSWFAKVGEGGTTDPALMAEPALASSEITDAWRRAGSAAVDVWRRPGVIEATYDMPFGSSPGANLARFMFVETLVHGWDLATATAQDATLDAELAEPALEMVRAMGEAVLRNPNMFGPEVAVDEHASVGDRLVGYLGRRP